MPKEKINLRPAKLADSELLLKWRNDPWIVNLGEQQKTVSKKEHDAWLAQKLQDHQVRIFIIYVDQHAVGSVRLEIIKIHQAAISIFLMKEWTGKGVGPYVIREAAKLGFQQLPIVSIVAKVLKGNSISQKAFVKAGFHFVEEDAKMVVFMMEKEKNA